MGGGQENRDQITEILAPPDVRLAAIAARQHGNVTTRQLKAAGLTEATVRARVKRGVLHRKYVGVFAVGHPRLSRERARSST